MQRKLLARYLLSTLMITIGFGGIAAGLDILWLMKRLPGRISARTLAQRRGIGAGDRKA